MPKRERSVTVRFSDEEADMLSILAKRWDMEAVELVRKCVAVGLPVLESIPFARRIMLEDSAALKMRQ